MEKYWKNMILSEKALFYLSNSMVFEKHDFHEKSVCLFYMFLSWATPLSWFERQYPWFLLFLKIEPKQGKVSKTEKMRNSIWASGVLSK